MSSRVLRATILAGLAAFALSTHVFVAIDRVRAKVVQAPIMATDGLVRAPTEGFPEVRGLRPPFALIARINSATAGPSSFSIAIDGAPVCETSVAGGGSQRIDCTVTRGWSPATERHEVAIHGPPTAWTLKSLELATHHGNTDGAHYVVVLPAASERYVRPPLVWVIAAGLLLLVALLLSPAPAPRPPWIRLLYRVLVGAVVLELVISLTSEWFSNYRLVLSAGTFARLLALTFVPRLWSPGGTLRPASGPDSPRPLTRWGVGLVPALVLLLVGSASAWELFLKAPWGEFQTRRHAEQARARLLEELRPVKLTNCEFQRFGEANDGGYLLCANLLDSAQSAYSYGISGYDQWGCDVTRRLSVPVHEYDCFNLQVPACPGGRTVFHGECIGPSSATIEGRPFDTLERQFAKNGDAGKHLVIKMDVEGAEWDSFQQAPDAVMQQINQLAIELHGLQEPERFTAVLKKLKRFFYVASLHFNNFACAEGVAPFPADVYEALFVSKRLAVPGGSGPGGAPAALLTPNITTWSDCQSLADLPPVRPGARDTPQSGSRDR